MKTKKVYLVGAGPGNPGLITVRGLEILRQADTVVYDYLVDKRILEQAKEGAELICCDKLRNKINDFVIKKVNQGKKVIRLKNGDPSIFARCSQELNALVKEKIEFEVVPGVTAANVASCLSGIPLTDRRFASSCVFVTGHEDPKKKRSLIDPSISLRVNGERSRTIDWNSITKSGTIILYMAVGNLNKTVKSLLKAGKDKDTPVAIVQNISLPTQKVLTGTLKDIVASARSQEIKPPAIVIIGEVVKLEREFNWLKKNRRVLFTGLSNKRYFTKGTYFHLPLVKIEPMKSYEEFDNYLNKIKEFDWIVFASRYGVEYFFKRLKLIGLDSRVLNNIQIAAIGNSTMKCLLDFGVLADLVPKKESSAGLIEAFKKLNLEGKKIFLPRSDISDKSLSKEFARLGARVTTGFAYRNVMPKDLPELDLNFFNEIIFTSPSTVRNFKKRYKNVPENVKIKCIGNVTLKEAKRCQLLG